MHWFEKSFRETYSAMCSEKLPSDQTKRLAGITEIGNGQKAMLRNQSPWFKFAASHRQAWLTSQSHADWSNKRFRSPSGPHIAAEKLTERLAIDHREPDPPAVSLKSKEQQLADLKRLTNGRTTIADQAN